MSTRTVGVVLAAAAALAFAAPALGGTFVVNSNLDTGGTSTCTGGASCTLRQAITAANALSGADAITFAAPQGPYLIQPATVLPQISDPVTIDGSGTTVQLDGSAAATLYGLEFTAASFPSAVKTLSLTRWAGSNGAAIKVDSGADVAVSASYIGTDSAENTGLGNYAGIQIDGTAEVGLPSATQNFIAGNTTGIAINGSAVVQNNSLGPAGGAGGNGLQAILIQSGSTSIKIGGTGSAQFNQIDGNGAGVRIVNPTRGVVISGNVIDGNTAGGIVFGFDNGHTANDSGDGDTGPNGLQNYPVLTSAYTDGSQIHVAGSLNSTATTSFTVEFFASSSCDSSGFGQGATYLGGDAGGATDGAGNFPFTATTAANASGFVTATATGPDGTSEFSNCVSITSSPPQTFTVNTATDTANGSCATTCTLRDAINLANAHLGPDTIKFAIPATGIPTITVDEAHGDLPAIGEGVTIDGTTQGSAPGVEITEGAGGSPVAGLHVTGGSTTIRGLVINGFPTQIVLDNGGGNTIVGDWLGLTGDGSLGFGGVDGIDVNGSANNTIGGTSAADRNVFATQNAIVGNGMSDSVVEGNYFGWDPAGTTFTDSVGQAVVLGGGGGNNTVGGTAAGARNVITTYQSAIVIGDSNDNTVQGNAFGTDPSEAVVEGVDIGVEIDGNATGNTIGGTTAAAANVFADAFDTALLVEDGGNTIEGNFIGTDRSGTPYATINSQGVRQLNDLSSSPNVYAGNLVEKSSGYGFEIVNGLATISGNTISGNGDVAVDMKVNSGVRITKNSIHDNGFPGILYEFADGNPNAPVVTGATIDAGTAHVTGSIPSPATGATYDVEIFRNAGNCSDGTEGETYLGTLKATESGGSAPFDGTVPLAGSGFAITATETNPGGSTSQFSNCWDAAVTAQTGPTYTVNSTADPGDGTCSVDDCTLREAIDAANADTDTNPGTDTIKFNLPGGGQQTITLDTSVEQVLGSPEINVTRPVVIDGTTEPGIAPSAVGVTIDGGAADGFQGAPLVLASGSGGSTVRGLAFVNYPTFDGDFPPLEVLSSGNTVAGNYFGVAADAKTTTADAFGVIVGGDNNVIGGTSAADRNVFVGSEDAAVAIDDRLDRSPTGNSVLGNYIGLMPDGANTNGNARGVELGGGAFANVVGAALVGGLVTGARNVIAGVGDVGVSVGSSSDGSAGLRNVVGGNDIGLDANGAPVPSPATGIDVQDATATIVGENAGPGGLFGLHKALGNVVSGAGSEAILLGSHAVNSIVAGNFLGVDRAGSATSPNSTGIHVVDASSNQLGPGNTVAHSKGAGIGFEKVTSVPVGDRIVANSIFDNGGGGITGMAPGTGVNRDLPAPTIAPISTSTVTGAATGPAGATIFIELFANASCAVAANGEGATFLQFVSATISAGGGPATWSATIGGLVDGQGLTATATNSTTSDTSAFSACTQVATPKAGLGLTADEASVPAGAANVPLASVPAGVLGQFAFAPVPNSPVPNSAVGAAPVPNSPVPNSPVPNSPVPNSPVPNSPVPNSGFDGIAATDLAKILLSSIPIDWSTIFVGTDPHAGVPVTGLTLADVYSDPPALTRFNQLKLGQLQLQNSLLRGVRLESILYGGTKLEWIPPYTQTAWCAAIAPASCTEVDVNTTTVLGLDVAGKLNDTLLGNLGKVKIGDITQPFAPVPNSPVPNSPVPNSPVPNSPVPNSALTLTAIGGVVIGNLYNPSLVVDCTKFTSTAVCLTKTLADAAALNAIKPSATFAMILAPKTTGGPSPLANVNYNAFAIGMVGLENLPWESWPFDGFQAFAGTGDVVHYHLTAPVPCASAYSLQVTLPHGFLVKAGTSSIVVGTGGRVAVPDPTQDATTGATWSTTSQGLPQANGCTGTQPAGLDFQALAGFRLGEQTATARLIAGPSTNSAIDQAPLTVTQNNEPDGDPLTAPAIQANTLAIGHIATSGDLDWRSFSTSGLPAGTKITVYLRPPTGTDLDLYLTKPGAVSLLSSPSPVPNSPVPNSPVPNSPVPNSPVPNSGDTLNRTSDNPAPEGLQDAPVPNSAIASYGITRGDAVEAAQVTLSGDESGSAIKIAVAGYNGDHSSDAYTLRVQVQTPPQLPACPARTFAYPSATVGTLPTFVSTTKTLFLVNYEAMGRTYGQSAADTLKARLNTFVMQHPDLNAAVLPVDGDPGVHTAKAAWDATPCSIPAANDVVRKINALVARYRATPASIQNIVIVGGDELIPMARVNDATIDANESSAAGDLLFTTQGATRANALFASEFLGNVLTDDAYAAGTIVPWFGGELDLPSFAAVGRLVETPAEIGKQLDAYDASGGVLDPHTGVVTGYDFMNDEATQIRRELTGRLTTTSDFFDQSTGWTAGTITPYFDNTLGRGGILSVNGHYNHWELAPAVPNPLTSAGLVRDTVLPGIATASQLRNAILFTMGCHGGLNVSDTYPFDTGKQQQLRDWAQALAQNGAGVYVANTGYGYGDYNAIVLSEQLMTMFAHNLASDGTIGRKLLVAKQLYFGTVGIADPYAAKALQEATFYGLPFYAIGSRTEPADPAPVATTATTVTGVNAASFTWPTSFATTLVPHATARGTYWSTTANGVEYVDGRPIEPRADHEVTASGLTAHGVLLDSLTTHDTAVDPLIASPMIDNSAHEQELKVANATFPASFASIGHWTALGANHDELVFVPGQTRDGSIQRLVDAAGMHVLYSASPDTTPPLFTQVGSIVSGGTATIFAKVSDPSAGTGIALVRAFFTEGGNTWTFVDLTFDSTTGFWTGSAPVSVARIEAAFEAEDGAGNVAYTTDKGHLFLSLSGDHTPPQITVAAPIDNGAFAKGQVVPASYACSDEGGVAKCDGPVAAGANIDTAQYGPHTFFVTAKDLSGNTSTLTVNYTVGYRFSGFFQPVDNPPILNVAKAGSSVPVIFSLGGNQGLSIFAAGSPSTIPIGCDNAAATSDISDTTDTANTSGLSYDAKSGQYTYVWKTVSSWKGTCRRLNVTFIDGTVHAANFKFK